MRGSITQNAGWCLIAIALASSIASAHPITDVFERVRDSVVVIATTENELSAVPGGQLTSVDGLGSGVLIDESGLILTASHVVQVAEEIEVLFTSGETIRADVVGSVPSADLALLKLERPPQDPVPAPLGDSDEAKVGDEIFIIGAPLGISYTLTVGHISARRVSDNLFGGFAPSEMLQTDAAINPGNSGGPMFDMNGRVIGIVSHIISQSGSNEGLGFVMTSNLARTLLLEQRSIWTGIEAQFVSGTLADALNVPQDFGALVQRVAKDSLASRLGLQAGTLRAEIEGQPIVLGGDVILTVQGIRLGDVGAAVQIRSLLRDLPVGEELKVTVLRDGQQIELAATRETP